MPDCDPEELLSPSPKFSICKNDVVTVLVVTRSTSLPAKTCTSVAEMAVSPVTLRVDPCTVSVFSASRLALPPMLSVLPTLRLEKASVVVSEVPKMPPPTPAPAVTDLVCVVTSFSRAMMFRLPPALMSALPAMLASVPAKVMSLAALACKLPPTVKPDLTWSIVSLFSVVTVEVPMVFVALVSNVRVTFLTVSKVMLPPACKSALLPALTCAPMFLMSPAALSDKSLAAVMPAVLPMVVSPLRPPPNWLKVSLLMLPETDSTATLLPLISPEMLLMLPCAVIFKLSLASILPPKLSNEATLMLRSLAETTALF